MIKLLLKLNVLLFVLGTEQAKFVLFHKVPAKVKL